MRIGLCPLNPTVGSVEANVEAMCERVELACRGGGVGNGVLGDYRPDLVVFPELAVCGYPPKDLLLQSGFVERCERAVAGMGARLPTGVTVLVGTPRRVGGGGVANSLAVVGSGGGGGGGGGGQVRYYDKRLLPTYDVFDEDRYFTPGEKGVVVNIGGVRVGVAVCEDLWRGEDAGFAARYAGGVDPMAELARMGIDVIISPSASPFVLGKGHRHRDIVAGHARRWGVPVMSVNQSGANDELVFDGHAFCYDAAGKLAMDGALFGEAMSLVELGGGEGGVRVVGASNVSLERGARSGERDLFDALVVGIRDYLRKCGFKKVLIGLSGGIDSALTCALAVAAVGREAVMGLAMPSKYSSGHSVEDALELARRVQIRCEVAGIETTVAAAAGMGDAVFEVLGERRLGERLPDIAEENLQSRVRGMLLMTVSNRTGAMVLTTGNKSEMAVGYCTLYGDMNGGLAVLSDVSKQWVYRLSSYINTEFEACGFSGPPIPERTMTKAPSAELRPDQKDQDSLPPYDVLDEIIAGYVERRLSVKEIGEASGIDLSTVSRIVRMIDLAEYKRKQAAIGLKVTSVAFGSGRRWPIAQRGG